MMIPYIPKMPTDRFNISPGNRLLDFGHLLLRVLVIFTLIFLGLGWTAEWVVSNMSVGTEEQVQRLFHRESNDKNESPGPPYIEELLVSPGEAAEINRGPVMVHSYLGELLVSLSEAAKINRGPVKVHLGDTEEVNARIRPDGEMMVFRGLLHTVQSENELAFVLAHELEHLKHRDFLKTLGRKLVFLVMSVALGTDWDVTNWFSVGIILGTGEMTGLHYDRRQEYAADAEGLAAVVKYYGHGGHALDLFKRLEETEQPSEHSWLSDHPTLCERIAHLRQVAKNRGWQMQGEATRLPNWQY